MRTKTKVTTSEAASPEDSEGWEEKKRQEK